MCQSRFGIEPDLCRNLNFDDVIDDKNRGKFLLSRTIPFAHYRALAFLLILYFSIPDIMHWKIFPNYSTRLFLFGIILVWFGNKITHALMQFFWFYLFQVKICDLNLFSVCANYKFGGGGLSW